MFKQPPYFYSNLLEHRTEQLAIEVDADTVNGKFVVLRYYFPTSLNDPRLDSGPDHLIRLAEISAEDDQYSLAYREARSHPKKDCATLQAPWEGFNQRQVCIPEFEKTPQVGQIRFMLDFRLGLFSLGFSVLPCPAPLPHGEPPD